MSPEKFDVLSRPLEVKNLLPSLQSLLGGLHQVITLVEFNPSAHKMIFYGRAPNSHPVAKSRTSIDVHLSKDSINRKSNFKTNG